MNKFTYEIFFRLNRNGEIVGCHRRDIRVIRDGDEEIEKELDPVPIEGPEMEAILGKINTSLILTLDSKTFFLNEAKTNIEHLLSENEILKLSNMESNRKIIELTDELTNFKQALSNEKSG
jgi:hypothetical protein